MSKSIETQQAKQNKFTITNINYLNEKEQLEFQRAIIIEEYREMLKEKERRSDI